MLMMVRYFTRRSDFPSLQSSTRKPDFRTLKNISIWIVVDARAGGVKEAVGSHTGMVRVLIMDADGSTYDSIRQTLGSLGSVPVFYLAGGFKGYEDCLKMTTAMNRGGGVGTTTPARESRAVTTRRTVAVGHKPCGSCP
jgi:hypothetical protein